MQSAVIMASGVSARYNEAGGGSQNKLLLPFGGKTVIEAVISALPDNLSKKLVVTRSTRIAELSHRNGCTAVLHSKPCRADTIRLGLAYSKGARGCLFLVGDQPLLSRASVERILAEAKRHPQSIVRLRSGETEGNPVWFPETLFPALSALEQNETGAQVIKNSGAEIRYVEADSPHELLDIDTPRDYELLLELLKARQSNI